MTHHHYQRQRRRMHHLPRQLELERYLYPNDTNELEWYRWANDSNDSDEGVPSHGSCECRSPHWSMG